MCIASKITSVLHHAGFDTGPSKADTLLKPCLCISLPAPTKYASISIRCSLEFIGEGGGQIFSYTEWWGGGVCQ